MSVVTFMLLICVAISFIGFIVIFIKEKNRQRRLSISNLILTVILVLATGFSVMKDNVDKRNIHQDKHEMTHISRIYKDLPKSMSGKASYTNSVEKDNQNKYKSVKTKGQALEKYHKLSKNLKKVRDSKEWINN